MTRDTIAWRQEVGPKNMMPEKSKVANNVTGKKRRATIGTSFPASVDSRAATSGMA